ncbi:hypothetical protein VTK56DRAFT_556 [Thermocarpiscus australiensis]
MPSLDTEQQFKFLLSCIKHSAAGKVNFGAVAEELGIVSKAAAAKRYERLLKAHDINPSATTPRKGGGKDSKEIKQEEAKTEAAGKKRKRGGGGVKSEVTIKDDDDDEEEGEPRVKEEPGTTKAQGRHIKKEKGVTVKHEISSDEDVKVKSEGTLDDDGSYSLPPLPPPPPPMMTMMTMHCDHAAAAAAAAAVQRCCDGATTAVRDDGPGPGPGPGARPGTLPDRDGGGGDDHDDDACIVVGEQPVAVRVPVPVPVPTAYGGHGHHHGPGQGHRAPPSTTYDFGHAVFRRDANVVSFSPIQTMTTTTRSSVLDAGGNDAAPLPLDFGRWGVPAQPGSASTV